MYPNQTSPLQLSQGVFLKSVDVSKSFLVFHNFGSRVSEYLELEMPYMILYESLDTTTRKCAFFEFTEAKKNLVFSSMEELERTRGAAPLHSHNFYELTFVLSGSIKLQIEDEIITYHSGECCLCNKNIHHKEIFDTDFEIVLFMFQEEYIKKILDGNIAYDENGKQYRQDTFFHKLFTDNNSRILYDAKEYIDFRLKRTYNQDQILYTVNSIIMEISLQKPGKDYMMKGLLCRFIGLLEDDEQYIAQAHWAKLSHEESIVYLISEIYEKYNGKLSREILEKETGYNADYLNRILKKRTGRTLTEYGRVFLLTIAADKLINTDENISKICEDLGYANRRFFNKLFIKQYGMTPSAFRSQKQDT